ncbi:ParB/RepB/Spo0J family partition protein [Kitasatospora azatica]|uniref:ParB/RepB/Spo0J family partition protein n=1 Tax=Kitasatospora azatica TaxID=58347 RepID=UPI000692374A|nr:ParB/RepB/Spo0J family partition protein [Kitasatospora azatica]
MNLADMLDGEPLDEPTQATPRPPVISVSLIAPNPDNPRGAVDLDDDDFHELVLSVQEVGIISPLTVCTTEAFLRHNPAHAAALRASTYVVVAGHRRLAAAQEAWLKEVPAYVNDSAAEDPLVWAVAENLLRVGLNPIQEAQALRVLTDPPPAGRGMAQTKAARGIGKTQGFVSQRIALLNLDPALQAKIASGELGLKAARSYVSLPREQQMAAYEAQASGYYPVMDSARAQPSEKVVAAEPVAAASVQPDPETYYPVMESEPSPVPDAPAPAPTQAAAQRAAGATKVADAAGVPEPRTAQGTNAVRDVDWHDVPAFADAIRRVLTQDQIGELAEALINNLGG